MGSTIRRTRSADRPSARVGPGSADDGREARRRRLGLLATIGVILLLPLAGVVSAIVVRVGNGGVTTTVGTDKRPFVGGDLHALAVLDGRIFVSGHGGAGMSSDTGRTWRQLPGLADKDGMGWAVSGSQTLVGGHGGLHGSIDGGEFQQVQGLPVSDVHGLGAEGDTVYVASPQGGVLASQDGGRTWSTRGAAGAAIMGTILVDSSDSRRLVAADMAAGVVASADGGESWRRLGGPAGATSVDRDPQNARRLVAVGVGGAQLSNDGGSTWTGLPAEKGTAAVAFLPGSPQNLIAAVLDGDRASVFVSRDDGATWSPVGS